MNGNGFVFWKGEEIDLLLERGPGGWGGDRRDSDEWLRGWDMVDEVLVVNTLICPGLYSCRLTG